MRLAALAAALLLAGCASSSTSSSSGSPASGVPAVSAAFTLGNDASGCVEDVALLLVPPAQAQAALPDGWVAADAQAFLGTPVGTGQGLLWLNGYTCDTDGLADGKMSGAEISVLVQPPTLRDGTVPSSSFHLYELAQVTSSTNVSRTLDSIGFPVLRANVTHDAPLPGGLVNRGTAVRAGSDLLYSFRFLGTPNQPLTGVATFWHENAAGTAYLQFHVANVPLDEGLVTACVIGPAVQALIHQTACPATTLGARASPMAWTGTLTWMPGAHTAK